jgi:hypothetical protein
MLEGARDSFSATWLAVRVGPWTIVLPRQIEGKFPDVDAAISE